MRTQKVEIVALRPFTYGTRRLVAGDVFHAMPLEARAMNAMGKTRAATAADKKKPDKAKKEDDEEKPRKAPPKKKVLVEDDDS